MSEQKPGPFAPDEIDAARDKAEQAWEKADAAIDEVDKLGEEEPPKEKVNEAVNS